MARGCSYIYIARSLNEIGNGDGEIKRDLVTAYWGFWVVGLGTIVWAYGDLVEYLIT
jgi:hypothetical protein